MNNWQFLWRGRCRIYYNQKEDAPFIWSVDDGHIENEYKVRNVLVSIPGCYTNTRTEDMSEQPKVWIEHAACAVYINENQEVKLTYK